MQLYKEGKIIRLLEEIAAYANREHSLLPSTERASLIITTLTRNWGFFEIDDRGFFTIPFAWRLLFCIDPLLKAMDLTARFACIDSIFKDINVQPSTLALLLQDFETQLGRFTNKGTSKDDAIFSLEEVLKLEGIFKNRALDAIDSREALKQYQGLNFLWLLGQIDEELVVSIKKSLISDDISLVKVISYCTTRASIAIKMVTKARGVNKETLREFIDVNEAYQRIKRFVVTSQFFTIAKDDQMNAVAFILMIERNPSPSIAENNIAEENIEKALIQLREEFDNNK